MDPISQLRNQTIIGVAQQQPRHLLSRTVEVYALNQKCIILRPFSIYEGELRGTVVHFKNLIIRKRDCEQ